MDEKRRRELIDSATEAAGKTESVLGEGGFELTMADIDFLVAVYRKQLGTRWEDNQRGKLETMKGAG